MIQSGTDATGDKANYITIFEIFKSDFASDSTTKVFYNISGDLEKLRVLELFYPQSPQQHLEIPPAARFPLPFQRRLTDAIE